MAPIALKDIPIAGLDGQAGQGAKHGAQGMAFTAARLTKGPNEMVKLYNSIPALIREQGQMYAFLAVDIAHLVMLAEQGIVSKKVARKILPVLLELRAQDGKQINIDPERGSLLLQIEGYISSQVGEDVAGQLHTGRSRIDQGATVRRIFKRDSLLDVMRAICGLQDALLLRAREHLDTCMPTYTHLQQAQPGTFGHYLLGITERLADDHARCVDAYARVNRCPLGSVGFSGTSWPLNRQRTMQLLGFDALVNNARIAREAYYAAEIAGVLSIVMGTLNDLCTDLHVWSSTEFGMVRCDDGFCSTSSIFPQKRNPVALEYVKMKSGHAVNWLGTALSTFRGEGTGDQNQRSVPFLDEAFTKTTNMLYMTAGIVATLSVDQARMQSILETSWSTTSNLADIIVRAHGLSFREAHHVVARLVQIVEQESIRRDQVSPEHLKRASLATVDKAIVMSQDDLHAALDHIAFTQTRVTYGSIGPGPVRVLYDICIKEVEKEKAWLDSRAEHLRKASLELDNAVHALLSQ